MYTLSVCVDTVMRHLAFEEGVRKISEAGFPVEFWWWTGRDVASIFSDRNIRLNAFTGYVGGTVIDPQTGGSTVYPDNVELFLAGVEKSLALAKSVNCRNLVISSGQLGPDGEVRHPIAKHPATMWITAYKTFCRVADLAEKYGVTYSVEHLNTKVDHAGYVFPNVEDVVRLVHEVGSPRIRLLLDFYQAQIQEGNISELIRKYHKYIGYIHVSDVPNRLDPCKGEINYPQIVRLLKEVGYEGSIGLESYPTVDPQEAMEDFRRLFS